MTYPGGKAGAGVYQRLINQMPPHGTYIEGFLGGGALMLRKRPARHNIGIDSNAAVLEQFTAAAGDSIPGLELRCENAIWWLQDRMWQGDEFVYLDPPYLPSTRSGKIYEREMGEDQHRQLLSIIKRIPAPVMISGYASDLYDERLDGWRVIRYMTMTRGGLAEEVAWMNYPEPATLHDYRYLGDDYRQRERLARKKKRLKAKLAGMPPAERYALLAALEEYQEEAREATAAWVKDLHQRRKK